MEFLVLVLYCIFVINFLHHINPLWIADDIWTGILSRSYPVGLRSRPFSSSMSSHRVRFRSGWPLWWVRCLPRVRFARLFARGRRKLLACTSGMWEVLCWLGWHRWVGPAWYSMSSPCGGWFLPWSWYDHQRLDITSGKLMCDCRYARVRVLNDRNLLWYTLLKRRNDIRSWVVDLGIILEEWKYLISKNYSNKWFLQVWKRDHSEGVKVFSKKN